MDAFRRGPPTVLYAAGSPLPAITAVTGHAMAEHGVGPNNTVWHYIDRGVILGLNAMAFLNGYSVDVTRPHYFTPVSPRFESLYSTIESSFSLSSSSSISSAPLFFDRVIDFHFQVNAELTPCIALGGEQRFLLPTLLACPIFG